MRFLVVPPALFVMLLAVACSDGQKANVSPPSGSADGTDYSACESRGRERVDDFFAALSDGDSAEIERMFPESMPGWQLQLSPGVFDAARWAKANSIPNLIGQRGLDELPSFDAFDRSEVAGVVSQLISLEFVGEATGDGVGVQDVPAFPFYNRALYSGELRWNAVGAPLEALGWSVVNGGGKISMDCETGMLVRILLSPLEFDEA